ncbi:MAG: enoyl-CoA hydratase-related protein, partial [Eubacteriales bacterium]
MTNTNFKTFTAKQTKAVLNVVFDFPPVNIQGEAMIADLNLLATQLETDKTIKVVVFSSANPEFFIAHADVNMLQHLSTQAVPRDKVQLDPLALVLDRISKLPQATIAQIEGYA